VDGFDDKNLASEKAIVRGTTYDVTLDKKKKGLRDSGASWPANLR
jgi:hypothetical protein